MFLPQAHRHYQGEAGQCYQLHKRSLPEKAVPWVVRLRAEKMSPHVPADATVLEYGVGQGWNLAGLLCRRKLGFDLENYLPTTASGGAIEYVAETKSLPDESIDIVICHHTLEHVPNPPFVLLEIRRLLARGGLLLLHVPQERRAKYDRFDAAEPNHHLYSWNVQTLGNLVQETGYKILSAKTGLFGYDRFAARLTVSCGLNETVFRALRNFLHIIRPEKEVRLIAQKTGDMNNNVI